MESSLLFVLSALIALNAGLGTDSKWFMTDMVRTKLLTMLTADECTASWPNVDNCVEWWEDTDEKLRYVLTNSIPPYEVAPYCPFGVGKGYCLPDGATNCSQFYGLTCPAQKGAPATGDVEVPQVMLYAMNLYPDPTNSSLPLNLYQLNPLTWSYDPTTMMEKIVNHKEDTSPFQWKPFVEKKLFSLSNNKRLLLEEEEEESRPDGPPPPNAAFQTTGVHLAGIQIKGPAEAEGYNVDTVDIPLICGGHVTPPIGAGPLYHFHKASFCLMENSTNSGDSHSALVGWMNDGFAMYGFHDIDGKAPVLDECNGHFGCLDDKCEDVTYHYHSNNYTYSGKGQFTPYWTGCLGPSKGICNTTVHQEYDNGADWCGAGCGYQICVQTGTNKDTLNSYISSFGDSNWLNQFTVNPF